MFTCTVGASRRRTWFANGMEQDAFVFTRTVEGGA